MINFQFTQEVNDDDILYTIRKNARSDRRTIRH